MVEHERHRGGEAVASGGQRCLTATAMSTGAWSRNDDPWTKTATSATMHIRLFIQSFGVTPFLTSEMVSSNFLLLLY
jgi:hypothetical protein